MKRSVLLSTAALGIALLPLGAAEAQSPFDNPGLYFGGYVGGAWGNVTVAEGDEVFDGKIDGFVAGLILGVRTARPPDRVWSAAAEVEVGFGNIAGETTVDVSPEVYDYDVDTVARVRGLIGFPNETVEPFVAIGAAFANLNVSEAEAMVGGTFVGLTLGAGANIAVSPTLIVRPEVLYDIYCDKVYEWGAEPEEYTVGLSMLTARVALLLDF